MKARKEGMAMERITREISATELKARCLALLDEVAASSVTLIVTKRGRPFAKLVPLSESPRPSLLGSVSYEAEGDLLGAVGDAWDADL
jgi:prevent-host-death family protein